MTDAERGKLDAFLKQAVANNRREPLIVMIRLAAEEGADARVGEVLAELGLKVSRTLSGGRLLVVTLKAEQLSAVAASANVARVSFDAFVTPHAKQDPSAIAAAPRGLSPRRSSRSAWACPRGGPGVRWWRGVRS